MGPVRHLVEEMSIGLYFPLMLGVSTEFHGYPNVGNGPTSNNVTVTVLFECQFPHHSTVSHKALQGVPIFYEPLTEDMEALCHVMIFYFVSERLSVHYRSITASCQKNNRSIG